MRLSRSLKKPERDDATDTRFQILIESITCQIENLHAVPSVQGSLEIQNETKSKLQHLKK